MYLNCFLHLANCNYKRYINNLYKLIKKTFIDCLTKLSATKNITYKCLLQLFITSKNKKLLVPAAFHAIINTGTNVSQQTDTTYLIKKDVIIAVSIYIL